MGLWALEPGRPMRSGGAPRNHYLLRGSEAWGDPEPPPSPRPSLLGLGKSDMGCQMAGL